MPGIFCIVDVILLFMRPAMAKVWPSCSSSSVSVRRVLRAGMRNPSSDDRVVEVERADLGLTFRWMRCPVHFRREVQADAELLEDDADADVGARSLRNRHGNLAAGKEAGFLAAFGHQVGLGEALEETARSAAP